MTTDTEFQNLFKSAPISAGDVVSTAEVQASPPPGSTEVRLDDVALVKKGASHYEWDHVVLGRIKATNGSGNDLVVNANGWWAVPIQAGGACYFSAKLTLTVADPDPSHNFDGGAVAVTARIEWR